MALKGVFPVLAGTDTNDDLMCIIDWTGSGGADSKGATCVYTDKASSLTKTYGFTYSEW